MNKARRAQLDAIYAKIEELISEVETITSDEQEYLDAMPESFQSGEKGDAAQNATTIVASYPSGPMSFEVPRRRTRAGDEVRDRMSMPVRIASS